MRNRDPNKLGLLEKINLGLGSAVLTAAGVFGLGLLTTKGPEGYIGYSLAVPLITTGIDFAIQKEKDNDTPLLSKRYAKALGVSTLGAALFHTALFGAAYVYFKHFFTLDLGSFY